MSYVFISSADENVGKSCILLRFTNDEFKTNHSPTVGLEFITQEMKIQNQVIKLQIWDSAGQEEYRSMTKSYYRSSSGV